MFKHSNNYYPEDAVGVAEIGKDDILDLLNEDDDKVPESDKKVPEKSKEDTEDKETEEDELVEPEEDKEPEVEDEEDVELVSPVRRKEILKKYPELFKDFPHLEKAYYREQKYAEILPSIDAAKEAVQKAESLDNFEASLLKGNTVEVLQTVKNSNVQAFNKIVDNYLPNLASVDQQAYFHVVGNVIKNAVISMKREGAASKDTDLDAAADILNKFMFGHTEVSAPTNLAKPEADTSEIELERQEFMKERFETSLSEVNHTVENRIKSIIDVNLDPRKSMSDYVRKAAAKEIFESVYTEVEKDERFSKTLDNLWKEASTKKFDKASTDRIRAAFISKAKTLLPTIIKKSRNEALKGLGKRVVEEKTVIRRSAASDDNSRPKDKKSAVPKGMSTLDFFNQD